MGGERSSHGTEMCTKFCPENLKRGDHMEDLCVDGKIMLQ
jgi:hypothetical protein